MPFKLRPLKSFHPVLENAADWLFPPVCINCGTEGSLICDDCLAKTSPLGSPRCVYCGDRLKRKGFCKRCAGRTWYFDEVRQYAIYAGALASAVRAIKYGHNFFLARHLTGMLLSAMEGCDWQVDLITAVPLSPRHERSRGYNQAALLAQPLADLLKLPYLGKAIRRSRETRSQVNLNLAERQLNVSGAFSANPDLVRGRRVLIVDDVYTTGATLNECARALKDSGAKEVYALALCKALHSLETASIG